jgi:hypothetical protein
MRVRERERGKLFLSYFLCTLKKPIKMYDDNMKGISVENLSSRKLSSDFSLSLSLSFALPLPHWRKSATLKIFFSLFSSLDVTGMKKTCMVRKITHSDEGVSERGRSERKKKMGKNEILHSH